MHFVIGMILYYLAYITGVFLANWICSPMLGLVVQIQVLMVLMVLVVTNRSLPRHCARAFQQRLGIPINTVGVIPTFRRRITFYDRYFNADPNPIRVVTIWWQVRGYRCSRVFLWGCIGFVVGYASLFYVEPKWFFDYLGVGCAIVALYFAALCGGLAGIVDWLRTPYVLIDE